MPIDAEVGNYTRQPASGTVIVGIFVADGPIALVTVDTLAAQPVGLPRIGREGRFPEPTAEGLEGTHFSDFREECEWMAALHALRVFEKNRLAAMAAVKDLHAASLRVPVACATGDWGERKWSRLSDSN